MQSIYSQYLCCPNCKSELIQNKSFLSCKSCNKKYPIKNDIVQMLPEMSDDVLLSIEKWDELYKKQLQEGTYTNDFDMYMNQYYDDTYTQLNEAKKIDKIVYLELGCGPFFFGQNIAKKCNLIIGIDFSPSALQIAKKMLDQKGLKNYLLIQGDILKMPIKDNTIDLIYGGGVIEHFDDTQSSVNELYRILKKNGVSFNTVPYLNLGSLTYRQVWGNIPNFPVLKQLAAFLHIKVLGGKHMIFGYEMSFMGSTLKKVHKKAGFRRVTVEQFKVNLLFSFLPAVLRKPFSWLATNTMLFSPMVKAVAVK